VSEESAVEKEERRRKEVQNMFSSGTCGIAVSGRKEGGGRVEKLLERGERWECE